MQINQHRDTKVGFGPCADRYIERWVRHLRRTDSFYHSNLRRITSGCNGVVIGEVLARGRYKPRDVVQAWLDSPTHRAVILDPRYERVGVAAVWIGDGQRLIGANFIRR